MWYIYPDRPPHISLIAWKAVTEETRILHRRWLQELRAMPANLLNRPLAAAAIELVRRMAYARDWKWSTTAKAFAAVAGALRNLPLYTNQTVSVDLNMFPEWCAAVKTAQTKENEEIPEPPPPITLHEELAAEKILMRKSPLAALFLAMMWAFSARAIDIATVRANDVVNMKVMPYKYVKKLLTIRRGKGAKFRGTYATSSTLTKQMGSLLIKILSDRRPNLLLFANVNEIQTMIASALKEANPRLQLASVRKGALSYYADKGLCEDQLKRMSGHTLTKTLQRYLGHGLQTTREDEAVQDNVLQLLRTRNTQGRTSPLPKTSTSTSTNCFGEFNS